MRVVILPNADEVSTRAADLICQTLADKPDAVLGLATGGTPLGTYQELIRRNNANTVDFASATTFNLDEYIGLPKEHPQSYRSFMHQNLFSLVNLDPNRCHLPDGESSDLLQACVHYEELIRQSGGIDLQLLGIGSDGHIAFNEPGSSLASRTRVKALTEQTRSDNARFFNSPDEVPKLALTMGIGTILESRKIVLIATGEGKASAVRSFIEGPLSAQVPASALQLHPSVTVLVDEPAANWLVRKPYYRHVEALQRELEA